MTAAIIQTSFASGEWAPKLRSRVDVQKYRSGAALLRNFFVDYAGGGASTRQGTKFIAQCKAAGARLIQFQASTSLSYVLEFGQNYIRFYSNGAQIVTAPNTPYEIASPYATADLFPNQATSNPGLKFVQDANSLIICHPNYPPAILTLNSPTNWTLTQITFGASIFAPTGVAGATNLSASTWNYAYIITSVDANGQESAPSTVATINNAAYIGTTQGTNSITWTAADGAQSYNVYKTNPSEGVVIANGAQYGFVGNVTGTTFTDAFPGVEPDFSQTPPILQNPFSGASVQSLNLTANATYTSVPSLTIGGPPTGIQATGYVSLGVASATINHAGGNQDIISSPGSLGVNPAGQAINLGNGVSILITGAAPVGTGEWEITSFSVASAGSITAGSTPSNPVSSVSAPNPPILAVQCTFNLTWHIGALVLISGGTGYITAPAVTITGGATATSTLGTFSAGNPAVPGFFQERLMLAAQPQAVQGYNLSQPGSFFNFNISNPIEADDAISGTIISEELNDIRNLVPVPAGIIAMTGRGAWVVSGGGGLSTLNPITPSNQTASPQAFNGGNDLKPQKINFDIIYGTNKGSYFRDLTYNVYANIFTGSDITMLSNHLFFNHYFLDITWAEEPFKTMWVVREDGIMLSLAFVKEQELIGWAHHDTNGAFKSVCSVIETLGTGNVVDAIYTIVERVVNGSTVQYVERMADRYFTFGKWSSWSVDAALQTIPNLTPANSLTVTGDISEINNSVTLTDIADAPFTNTMATNNWIVTTLDGGIYQITTFTSTSIVTAKVLRPPNSYNLYTNGASPSLTGHWFIWEPVTVVSGLSHLEGMQVVGVADGLAVGPLTVTGGSVTLPRAASVVTLGLAFLPQLRTLSIDVGEPTIQGKRKKISKITLRVADTLGLQIGTTFSTLVAVKDFQLNAIPSTSTGVSLVTDLVNPIYNPDVPVIDGLQLPDPLWQENGQFCVQQNLPYPATICGVIPELTPGDTK